MSNGLRKHLKQLPYFLLFNYPKKLKTYNKLKEKNKQIENKEDKLKLNAYHSPSPMNELCDYICTWEKKQILWNTDDIIDTQCLIIDNDLDLTDKKIVKEVRKYINIYVKEMKKHLKLHKDNKTDGNYSLTMREISKRLINELMTKFNLSEEMIANYIIKVSYSKISTSKSFAWMGCADYIIKNLKNNSNPKRNISIIEVPYNTNDSYEYLGKYYEFKAVNEYR